MEKQKTSVELQSFGAGLDVPVGDSGRCGGAGPSDDKAFLLDGIVAMVTTLGTLGQESPYAVIRSDDGRYSVTSNGRTVMPVEFVSTPKLYDLKTKDGISYKEMAVQHGI